MAIAEPPISDAVVVRNLRIELISSGEDIVDQIVLEVTAGQVLGLVGESGSGKTTVGMALLGYTRPGGKVVGGDVVIDGQSLQGLGDGELRRLRGGTVSYIPQDPGTALNPALRIGRQLSEMLEAHAQEMDKAQRDARIKETLEEVALPATDEFLKRYAHQLSGGQQQRVAIAMAFASRPHVIVCDEPTTGLDVTTQARVLTTVRELCQEHGVAALYVSHDLAVVAELADHVAVMYAGRIVEQGDRRDVFYDAQHPYTWGLLGSIARLDRPKPRRLSTIPGLPPSLLRLPPGCAFGDRCAHRFDRCDERPALLAKVGDGHLDACHLDIEKKKELRETTIHPELIEEAK
jgi:peptide/nickel transport system ATP-binding protein